MGIKLHKKIKTYMILAAFVVLALSEALTSLMTAPKVVAAGEDDFVTTWNSGADRVVKLPIYGDGALSSQYNFTVDWGDGTTESFVGNGTVPTHVYAAADTEYQIRISGTFYGWIFSQWHTNVGADVAIYAPKIVSLDQWGTNKWKSMSSMFSECSNMVANYSDRPDTSEVTHMDSMFHNAVKFNGQVNFNTSRVINMEYMFNNARIFNQSVDSFDTSSVISMEHMFSGTHAFNQPLNHFNTASVTNMAHMFNGARAFNQPLSFNTAGVNNMDHMFYDARAFDQDLSQLNFTSVQANRLFNFGLNAGFSVRNYDALLNHWNATIGTNGIAYTQVNMNNAKYCLAESARANLINTAGWGLTDSGKDCSYLTPNNVLLSGGATVDENSSVGAEVGILTAQSADANNTFVFSLDCSPAGNNDNYFEVVGNRLRLKISPDYEVTPILEVCVKTTEQLSGQTATTTFVIAVNDLLQLNYDGNGTDGGVVPASGELAVANSQVSVAGATMTRSGYKFTGWNTSADGTGRSYAPGSTLTLTADTTLYAQWQVATGNVLADTGVNLLAMLSIGAMTIVGGAILLIRRA